MLTVNVHDVKERYRERGNDDYRLYLKRAVEQAFQNEHIKFVDVYNLNGTFSEIVPEDKERLIIFMNTTRSAIRTKSATPFKGNDTTFFEPFGRDDVVKIEIGGRVVAAYADNRLDILFPLNNYSVETSRDLFQEIIAKLNTHFLAIPSRHSWSTPENRERLEKEMKDKFLAHSLEAASAEKRRAEETAREITDAQKRLKLLHDRHLDAMRKHEQMKAGDEEGARRYIEQLDLAASLPKVADLQITGSHVTFAVPSVYAYDKHDNRYYIGNMNVKVSLESSQVKISGDNPRQGYWTQHDPHPHVSGRDGSPCLGNVSSTIAELVSRKEIYALAITVIDYLENANVDDPAGMKVRNWDLVDEEGNIIDTDNAKGFAHMSRCDCCEDSTPEDEMMTVFDDAAIVDGEIRVRNERQVCDYCRENNYYYWDSIDEYVHDSYSEEDMESELRELEEEEAEEEVDSF